MAARFTSLTRRLTLIGLKVWQRILYIQSVSERLNNKKTRVAFRRKKNLKDAKVRSDWQPSTTGYLQCFKQQKRLLNNLTQAVYHVPINGGRQTHNCVSLMTCQVWSLWVMRQKLCWIDWLSMHRMSCRKRFFYLSSKQDMLTDSQLVHSWELVRALVLEHNPNTSWTRKGQRGKAAPVWISRRLTSVTTRATCWNASSVWGVTQSFCHKVAELQISDHRSSVATFVDSSRVDLSYRLRNANQPIKCISVFTGLPYKNVKKKFKHLLLCSGKSFNPRAESEEHKESFIHKIYKDENVQHWRFHGGYGSAMNGEKTS